MPVFIAKHVPANLSDFVAGYLECAEFTFTDYDDEGNETDRPVRGWSAAAKKRAEADCAKFMNDNAENLALYYENYWVSAGSGYSPEACAGHDFWYSRNGHGVGFSDRGNHACFEALQTAAGWEGKVWRELDVYRSDSAWLCFG